MSKEELDVIEKLLKLYPDVIDSLGGEEAVKSDSILERINSYISKHKWFVNENIPFTISLEQAFFSWHENVFLPQSNEMERTNITSLLSSFSKYDLFKLVADEYYFLQEKDSTAYHNKACYAVIARESKSFLTRRFAKIKFALLN